MNLSPADGARSARNHGIWFWVYSIYQAVGDSVYDRGFIRSMIFDFRHDIFYHSKDSQKFEKLKGDDDGVLILSLDDLTIFLNLYILFGTYRSFNNIEW